jgi:hypothetical protein
MAYLFQHALFSFSKAMKATRPTTVEDAWVRLSEWTTVLTLLSSVRDEDKDSASQFLSESERQIKKYEALIKTFTTDPPLQEEDEMPPLAAMEQTV